MIRYIHFAQQFDALQLQQEVALLQQHQWKNHYNQTNYEGNWTTIQLRSINGSVDNNSAVSSGAQQAGTVFLDTPLLNECAYIKSVIDFFEFEKTTVRLMKLDAGAIIKPHNDGDLNFEEGEVRIHIPVVTNDQLYFLLEEERLQMQEGTCWYLNLSLTHSVRNEGNTDRIHLVIDGIVNDWLQHYFNEPAHNKIEMDDLPKHNYSDADKINIIAQLRSMQTDTGNKLADEMEAALNQFNS